MTTKKDETKDTETTQVAPLNPGAVAQGVDAHLPPEELPTGKEKGKTLQEAQTRIAEGAGTMPRPERDDKEEDPSPEYLGNEPATTRKAGK